MDDLDQKCNYHCQETFIDSVIFIITSPTNSLKARINDCASVCKLSKIYEQLLVSRDLSSKNKYNSLTS